jgi:hypothetical protein
MTEPDDRRPTFLGPVGRRVVHTVAVFAISAGCEPEVERRQGPSNWLFAGLTCAGACPISLQRIATLGEISDSISPGYFAAVTRSAEGEFYVGGMDSPGTVAVYGADGRLARTFGRRGDGPGEYDWWLIPVRGPGDTIIIFDNLKLRATLLEAGDAPGRTFMFPAPINQALYANGTLLIQADIRTPERIGQPIHSLTPHGGIAKSFGGTARYSSILDGVRAVAPARDGGFVSAPPNRYEVHYFDSSYVLQRVIEIPNDFFQPYAAMVDSRTAPPRPMIRSLYEDSTGLLWLVISVAAADWRPRAGPVNEFEEQPISTGRDIEILDWLVEVVDPTEPRRLASARSNTPLRLSEDGLLYVSDQLEDGRTRVTVFRAHLMNGGRQ